MTKHENQGADKPQALTRRFRTNPPGLRDQIQPGMILLGEGSAVDAAKIVAVTAVGSTSVLASTIGRRRADGGWEPMDSEDCNYALDMRRWQITSSGTLSAFCDIPPEIVTRARLFETLRPSGSDTEVGALRMQLAHEIELRSKAMADWRAQAEQGHAAVVAAHEEIADLRQRLAEAEKREAVLRDDMQRNSVAFEALMTNRDGLQRAHTALGEGRDEILAALRNWQLWAFAELDAEPHAWPMDTERGREKSLDSDKRCRTDLSDKLARIKYPGVVAAKYLQAAMPEGYTIQAQARHGLRESYGYRSPSGGVGGIADPGEAVARAWSEVLSQVRQERDECRSMLSKAQKGAEELAALRTELDSGGWRGLFRLLIGEGGCDHIERLTRERDEARFSAEVAASQVQKFRSALGLDAAVDPIEGVAKFRERYRGPLLSLVISIGDPGSPGKQSTPEQMAEYIKAHIAKLNTQIGMLEDAVSEYGKLVIELAREENSSTLVAEFAEAKGFEAAVFAKVSYLRWRARVAPSGERSALDRIAMHVIPDEDMVKVLQSRDDQKEAAIKDRYRALCSRLGYTEVALSCLAELTKMAPEDERAKWAARSAPDQLRAAAQWLGLQVELSDQRRAECDRLIAAHAQATEVYEGLRRRVRAAIA